MNQENIKVQVEAKVQIVKKTKINHDCYRMQFKFLENGFKISIAQSINISALIKSEEYPDGETVSRRYSIISPSSIQKNAFQIMFKVYRPNQQFLRGGKMTTLLEKLQVGSILNIQGPFSRFQYSPQGNIALNGDKYKFKRIFFMAGGSGITPCYQTIRQIYEMKDQKIELILLFANKSEEDIVLRKQIDEMAGRVKVHYLLQKYQQNWKGLKGLVTVQILQSLCPLNDPQTLYIHCGPIGMTKVIVLHFLKYFKNMRLFKF